MSSVKKLSVGIIGLGLIGGSVARSLRHRFPNIKLTAHDANSNNTDLALRDKTINAIDSLENVVKCSNILVLAMPPFCNIETIQRLPEIVNDNTVITDVSSVKSAVNAVVELTSKSFQRNFVMGHPLSGSEQSGYAAASNNLFDGRNVILTPNKV